MDKNQTKGSKPINQRKGENPITFTVPNFSKTTFKSSREITNLLSLSAAAEIFSSVSLLFSSPSVSFPSLTPLFSLSFWSFSDTFLPLSSAAISDGFCWSLLEISWVPLVCWSELFCSEGTSSEIVFSLKAISKPLG